MNSSQPPTTSSELVRAQLLLAREKLVAQQKRLETEFEQLGQGIQGIDAIIEMVCESNLIGPSMLLANENHSNTEIADALTLAADDHSLPDTLAPSPKKQTNQDTSSPPKSPNVKAKPATSKAKQSKSSGRKTAQNTGKGGAAALTKSKRNTKKTADKQTNSSKRRSSKPSGRTSTKANKKTSWKTYLLKDYQDQPLTEVVMSVFQESPDAVLASSDLISRIFVPEIPKDVRATARDRLLNILSLRVADNQLERVGSGKYKLSGSPTA